MHTYHYDFWKDGAWLWLLLSPLGLLMWAMPFLFYFVVPRGSVPEGVWAGISWVLIGLPAYLVGYIFIYALWDVLFTRVTFESGFIRHRHPSPVFPLILLTRIVNIADITSGRSGVAEGIGRTAVALQIAEGSRTGKVLLPGFKDPAYRQEIDILLGRTSPAMGKVTAREKTGKKVAQTAAQTQAPGRLSRYTNPLEGALVVFVAAGSGLMAWQAGGRQPELIASAASAGLLCILLGFCGLVPLLGQVLYYGMGRGIIAWIYGLVGIQPALVRWQPPAALTGWLGIAPAPFSLLDLTYWGVFAFSLVVSASIAAEWWLGRRNRA